MQDISVAKDGILYLFKCISLYNGSCLFPLFYIGILLAVAIKGSRDMKRIFLYPVLVMLFSVYNPFIPLIVDRIFDINKEYYRFLWITPVSITMAAASAYFVMKKNRKPGWRVMVFSGIICIMIGAGSFIYSSGYHPIENKYKIPNEVIAVAKMIRGNTDMKYPVAICDRDMQMELRQYDASILLSCDRTQYLDFLGDAFEDALTAEKNVYVNRLLAVVGKGEKIDPRLFTEALDKTNTQFVVVPKTAHVLRYLTDAGLEAVGTTGTRVVFRYELKDPIYYELADYS